MKHEARGREPLALLLIGASGIFVLAISNWGQVPQRLPKMPSTASKVDRIPQRTSNVKAKAASAPLVPDVNGKTCVEAARILEANFFGYECINPPSSNQHATRTDPAKGSASPPQSTVKIYFDVEVPTLKGHTVKEASVLLSHAGLLMDQQQAASTSGDPGSVSAQSPDPHTFVPWGSSVRVEVVPDKLTISTTSQNIRVGGSARDFV
jgi:PASTA domain